MTTNKNLSTDRRFSLNLTPLPIAESTCLNGTRKPQAIFQWGSPISPKNRSNSSICLLENIKVTTEDNKNSPARLKANRSKIDPRIYADVQSKGLASRIVKYHENGTNLNRSLSVNNLYSKPGHFPVVHLKKTELPYRATRQNVSMTRIAPPEKSMFYGNTLSGLLRSNSIIGLHKSDEELSRENRPIIHPPPTENDLAPTRSVLDVLKEISRKRINSDDVESSDVTKKYCNRDLDNVDSQSTDVQRLGTPTQSFKRQRDHLNHQYHQVNHQQHSGSTLSTSSAPSYSPQSKTSSPEQMAKKRLCSYNNDITSSLSSSQIHTNKRKLIEQKRALINTPQNNLNASRSNDLPESISLHRNKILKQQSDAPYVAPPKTSESALSSTRSEIISRTDETAQVVPPTRTTSEPLFSAKQSKPSARKPKLTLFNKDYDEKAEDATTKSATDIEDGDHAGIQFVKPKKSSSITGLKNPLIERTQKSKLALMLCGLRGELYQGDEDVVDNGKNVKISSSATSKANAPTMGFTLSATTNIVSLSTSTTTTKSLSTIPTTAASENNSAISKSIIPTAPAGSINQSSLFGSGNASKSTAPAIATTSSTTTATTSVATPLIGGFNFTPSPTTVTSTANKTVSPLVGIKLAPQKPSNSTASPPTFSFGVPVASSAGSTSTLTLPKTSSSSLPVLNGFPTGGFSFGMNTTTASNPLPTSKPQLTFGTAPSSTAGATKTTSLFTLGSTTMTFQPTTAPTTATTGFGMLAANTFATPSSSSTSFGGIANVQNASKTTLASTAATVVKPFSFGSVNSNANNTIGVSNNSSAGGHPPPIFGSTSGANASNPPPVFGSVATTTAASSSTKLQGGFSFGAIGAQSSLFGAGDASKANAPATGTVAPPPFSFGATSAKPESSQFTFGAKSNETAAKPSSQMTPVAKNLFGASTPAPSTATPNLFATSSNIFGGSASTSGNPATTTSSSSTGNLFAAPSANSLTGVVKPSFGFGNAGNAASSSTSLFGGSTTGSTSNVNNNNNKTNTFGGLNANQSNAFTFGSNANATASTTNLFATADTASKPAGTLTFGSSATSTAADANKPAGGITFGTSNNTNSTAAPVLGVGTFSFGSSNNPSAAIKPNTFSFGASSATSGGAALSGSNTFTFGNNNTNTSNNTNNNNNNNNNNTNTVTPFSFSSNAASTNSLQGKIFPFGSATPSTSTAEKPVANVFGTQMVGSNASGPPKPAAFNFAGDASPSASPTFGAPAIMTNGNRTIRRATRRLNKT